MHEEPVRTRCALCVCVCAKDYHEIFGPKEKKVIKNFINGQQIRINSFGRASWA